jgi:hypothetical protein
MNKKQEHTQQIFREMVSILTEHFDNPDAEPVSDFEELADALNRKGLTNQKGKPFSHWTLRKMIERCNEVNEEDDFRHQFYPTQLFTKDEGVGLRQVQFVTPKPISKIDKKKSDDDELKKLFTEHEENYFGWTVQNVQQSL